MMIYLKSLRETSVEGVQLERALQRIESLQNQLRNIDPVPQVYLNILASRLISYLNVIDS